MSAGPMVLCDLSGVKKVIEKKPDAATARRPFAPTMTSGLSKLVTNKDEALAKFLKRKQMSGQRVSYSLTLHGCEAYG